MAALSVKVTIVNRLGLHARPAMCFVDAASAFTCSVTVSRPGPGGTTVDGKSIMQMMMLAATKGTELDITCDGDDAQAACELLKKLVESGFEEE
ncbi:MAG: HPr family phosphocarrier protein [Phycisphaeraceae bacterium]|nr:HPr family phosphocarrier protein [Phycisphaeraceae bacterium]